MLAADNLVDKTKTLFGQRQTAGKTAGQLGAEDGTSAESDSGTGYITRREPVHKVQILLCGANDWDPQASE